MLQVARVEVTYQTIPMDIEDSMVPTCSEGNFHLRIVLALVVLEKNPSN